MVKVEIIYIPEEGAMIHLELNLQPGATISDALNQSNLLNTHPEIKIYQLGFLPSKKISTPY